MPSKAFNWGRAIAHNNFQEFGKLGIAKSDKAFVTCMKYANNNSVKRTNKGVVLTKQLRNKYRDMANGLLQGYNDICSGKHYRK